jgi:hypothetical protein
VVLALTRLRDDEGNDARMILERGLDDWAAESGLASLNPLDEPTAPEPVFERGELDSPIDHDELELAFSQAEAQVDEMIDVNRVAERVLMDEPESLASEAGDELVSIDDSVIPEPTPASDYAVTADSDLISEPASGLASTAIASAEGAGVDAEVEETDAAWVESGFWPASVSDDDIDINADSQVLDEGAAVRDETFEAVADSQIGDAGLTSRDGVLATLEQWLVNLEGSRARRAQ